MVAKRLGLLEFLNQDIVTLLSKSVREPRSRTRVKTLRSSRHLAPFGASAIQGELVCSEGEAVPVSLWDLSESGCCVVVHGPLSLHHEQPITLSFRDPAGQEPVRLNGNLLWSDRSTGTIFAGLRLTSSSLFLRQSFLGSFLKPSA